MVLDPAEGPDGGHFARKPVPLAFVVFQVELGITMAGDPHGPRRDANGAAHGDEQRGEVLDAAGPIAECRHGALDLEQFLAVFQPAADKLVDRLDLLPGVGSVALEFLQRRLDLGVLDFDHRTGQEVRTHVLGEFFGIGQDVDVGLLRRKQGVAAHFVGDQGLGFGAGRNLRDPDDHHLGPIGGLVRRADAGRESPRRRPPTAAPATRWASAHSRPRLCTASRLAPPARIATAGPGPRRVSVPWLRPPP